MSHPNRRDFIKQTALFSSLIPLLGFSNNFISELADDTPLSVNIFSKHLQFLTYEDLGAIVSEMGFDGVDLTVRPKGHVLPEKVITDLPLAVNAIRKNGLNCDMITTSIETITNPLDYQIIQTAASLGVKYYRTNWFQYPEGLSMSEALIKYQQQIKELGILNKDLGIVGCYQNHAGRTVGASFWEIKSLLETVDSNYFGTQYDIRHAMVEGANSWENGLKLLQSQIKTIVLKDFKWAQVNGTWEAINTPIGEGMVDFNNYFKLLKSYGLKPPVSLHLEYDLGGAEKGDYTIAIDQEVVFAAMKKDLTELQRLWRVA